MKYGLIGKKLGHSYSKAIHGLLGNSDYELVEIPPEEVADFMKKADFLGVNVTIPYKETVMPFVTPDEAAKKIGCVNTIVNRGGELFGYNTDYFGFLYTAERAGISFDGRKALILGSGGTSKTAACAAKDAGAAEIVVVSRTGENNYGNITRHADADIIINTTPVGMFPDTGSAPVDLKLFEKPEAVIDVVNNPLRTRLALEAAALGLKTAGGFPMLVAQAARAHEIFFAEVSVGTYNFDTVRRTVSKLYVPTDTMGAQKGTSLLCEAIISEMEKRISNIVLIGMPGSGKTTIGKALALRIGRAFVDTDDVIEAETGRKAPEIIREEGEAAFRKYERRAVAEAAARSGLVIATGGGAVLAEENRFALRQNGTIFFLERELEKLATDGRPLSADLPTLYRQRLPIYESLCQCRIKVTENTDESVQNIMEALL